MGWMVFPYLRTLKMNKKKGYMLPLPDLLEIYDQTDDPDIQETMRRLMLASIREDAERKLLTWCRPRKRLFFTEVGS